MGRYLTATEIGSTLGYKNVHKFWFAIQDSTVEDYLSEYEPPYMLADLDVSQEAEITERMHELEKEFRDTFGYPVERLMRGIEGGYAIDKEPPRDQIQLAARIDLGRNLLSTIKQMKLAGVTEQTLEVEL